MRNEEEPKGRETAAADAADGAAGVPIYKGRSRRKPAEADIKGPEETGSREKEAGTVKTEETEETEEAETKSAGAEENLKEESGNAKEGETEETEAKETAESETETAGAEQTPEAEVEAAKSEEAEITPKKSEEAENPEGEQKAVSPEEAETAPAEPEAQPKSGRGRLIGFAAAVIVLAAAGYYAQGVIHYQNIFSPGTTVNGIGIGERTLEGAEERLSSVLADQTITITERGGTAEEIPGAAISLDADYTSSLKKMLALQNPWLWILHRRGEEYTVDVEWTCDEEALADEVAALDAVNPANWQEPEAARISDYREELKGYEVIPAFPGTELSGEKVRQAVLDAIAAGETSVDLESAGCYVRAASEEADPALIAAVQELNLYAGASVNYTFDDETETLDGSTIHNWLSIAEDGSVVLDEAAAAAYVTEFASRHNSVGKEVRFMTSYGEEVTVPGGSYGDTINEKKELETLLASVYAGESVTREPEYTARAKKSGGRDYGDTYVEVNLTKQHLFFYKDGELVVETDFVSGNEARKMSTPAGAYYLKSKTRNAVLVGRNYRTPVSYWMPFNGGIGLHDATWRNKFGGTIYKTNGSHGCVNLPKSAAKLIFEQIEAGDPVFCYHLDTRNPAVTAAKAAETTETEKAAQAAKPAKTQQTAAAAETPAAQTENGDATSDPTESAAASTEGTETSGTTAAVETTQAITAGGDEESFGPGFTEAAPETAAAETLPETAAAVPETEFGPGI